jgi:hypothetical protein
MSRLGTHLAGFLIATAFVGPIARAQQAPPSEAKGATIHGFLFDAVTGNKITGVVVLQDRGRRPVKQSSVLGKELEYRITDIPEGTYYLHIQGFFNRYIEKDYGQLTPDDPPTELRLTPGASIEISFTVERAGSISGRLNDPEGRPVQNAEVQLLTLRYDNAGNRFLASPGNLPPVRVLLGNYGFPAVPPGEYYIRAAVALPAEQRGAQTPVNHNVRTYYPGVKSSEEAAPIVMPKASTTLPNINFFFKDLSQFKVTGTIVFPTQARVKEPLYTYLIPKENLYSRLLDPPQPILDFDPARTTFELRNVPPGRYDLYVGSITDYVPTPDGAPNFPGYSARVPVEVRDKDIVDLVAELKPGVDLHGEFNLNRSTVATNLNFAGFLPVFIPQDGKPWPLAPAASASGATFVRPDGSFDLIHAAAGEYRIGAVTSPDLYLADAWLGSRNIMGQTFEIDSKSDGPLVLELRTDGAKFEGTVTDVDDVAANALVVLVPPTEFRNDPGVSKTARTDKEGHFAISGIRPGLYTVFAFPKIDNNAWLNDEYMTPYRALGLQINFGKGTLVYRDFKSVPMPR